MGFLATITMKSHQDIVEEYGLLPRKLELIDVAASSFNPKSWIDLGGTWRVRGGYSYYISSKYTPETVTLCDITMPQEILDISSEYGVRCVEGSFGCLSDKVGDFDAALMFDILLHQYYPDWMGLLALYSKHVKVMLVVNPQAAETKLIVDLPTDEYRSWIPQPILDSCDMYESESSELKGRSAVWQWAISNRDLISVMATLGFEVVFLRDYGRFLGCEKYHNVGFIFARNDMRCRFLKGK